MNVSAHIAEQFVTGTIGNQSFALPIVHVRDVFVPERITPVPRAPRGVAGVLNLRGHILTAIDLRTQLGACDNTAPPMAIGVEYANESYGFLVDSVDDVIALKADERESVPGNLDPAVSRIAAGVHERDQRLLILLDVDRILETTRNGN